MAQDMYSVYQTELSWADIKRIIDGTDAVKL